MYVHTYYNMHSKTQTYKVSPEYVVRFWECFVNNKELAYCGIKEILAFKIPIKELLGTEVRLSC